MQKSPEIYSKEMGVFSYKKVTGIARAVHISCIVHVIQVDLCISLTNAQITYKKREKNSCVLLHDTSVNFEEIPFQQPVEQRTRQSNLRHLCVSPTMKKSL